MSLCAAVAEGSEPGWAGRPPATRLFLLEWSPGALTLPPRPTVPPRPDVCCPVLPSNVLCPTPLTIVLPCVPAAGRWSAGWRAATTTTTWMSGEG